MKKQQAYVQKNLEAKISKHQREVVLHKGWNRFLIIIYPRCPGANRDIWVRRIILIVMSRDDKNCENYWLGDHLGKFFFSQRKS
jgi:hypothetical protein